MKKLISFISLFFLTTSNVNAEQMFQSNIINAYAVAIFNEKGIGENVQALRETKNDYNGIVYTKIAFFGKLYQGKPKVNIGASLGHFIESKPIYKNSYLIGKEMTYKHYTVTKGYLEVRVNNKLFDSKVYVK